MANDFDISFKLVMGASDIGVGGVKEDDEGIDHPLSFYCKKMNIYQKRYSAVEIETIALILALHHFEVYVNSGQYLLEVFTDCNPPHLPAQHEEQKSAYNHKGCIPPRIKY